MYRSKENERLIASFFLLEQHMKSLQVNSGPHGPIVGKCADSIIFPLQDENKKLNDLVATARTEVRFLLSVASLFSLQTRLC